MPKLAKVTSKYLPISYKDTNLFVVAKSTYIQFLAQELSLAVKRHQNPTNLLF